MFVDFYIIVGFYVFWNEMKKNLSYLGIWCVEKDEMKVLKDMVEMEYDDFMFYSLCLLEERWLLLGVVVDNIVENGVKNSEF